MTDVAGVIDSIFALDSEFLSVVTLPVAVQLTGDIMLLSGGNSRQTTYNQQDSGLTSKHLGTALIYDGYVEPPQGGTVYTCQSLFFFEVFLFTF